MTDSFSKDVGSRSISAEYRKVLSNFSSCFFYYLLSFLQDTHLEPCILAIDIQILQLSSSPSLESNPI